MKRSDDKTNSRASGCFDTLLGLLFFLFFRIWSWVCSLPMWLTLILHVTIDLPLYWFWATLGAWLLLGVLHYLLVRFARWGAAASETTPKENKNPYSVRENNKP